MTEEFVPDVRQDVTPAGEISSDVLQTEVPTAPEASAVHPVAELERKALDPAGLSEKTLAELISLFEQLMEDEDRVKRPKDAEAIKTVFYKKLSKEKADAGYAPEGNTQEESSVSEETPSDEAPQAESSHGEEASVEDGGIVGPFDAVESGFKSLYAKYKAERAEYNRLQDKERDNNLLKKRAVIEELKALVERQEDVKDTFPAFRDIQARWREIGPVPVQSFRNINDLYQFYVEQFYDKVQINRDMRDLDFKKNLEVKTKLCESAEALAGQPNVVEAFKELQKLHEQWKEYGPVSKEFRESIWERFRAATAVINKKYQGHFEEIKSKQSENLAAKASLCEQAEALAEKDVKSSNEWNKLSRDILALQEEWRKIGFASKKENQKIYERFRAACDKFFERKRIFYAGFKDSMNDNIAKKLAIIEQAEALKVSTEWKKATDQFIALQKQWKEVGAVPRKKSDQLWKRFRAACDEFFAAKEKNAKPENNFYSNLKTKKALIEEIKAYQGDDKEAMQGFINRWNEIGFVPFKEKDAVSGAYKDAMTEKFPGFAYGGSRSRQGGGQYRGSNTQRRPLTEKERLVLQYTKLQQDIDTYENNIGFFAASKNSAVLIQQTQQRIDESKQELKALEEKIRKIEDSDE